MSGFRFAPHAGQDLAARIQEELRSSWRWRAALGLLAAKEKLESVKEKVAQSLPGQAARIVRDWKSVLGGK